MQRTGEATGDGLAEIHATGRQSIELVQLIFSAVDTVFVAFIRRVINVFSPLFRLSQGRARFLVAEERGRQGYGEGTGAAAAERYNLTPC